MKLKMQGSGTVDVAERAFGADFNEALVHQVVTAFLAGSGPAQKRKKTVQGCAAAGQSPTARRAPGGRGPARSGVRFGLAVGARSLPGRVNSTRR